MASGDIYQLVDKQVIQGQEAMNVYFFRQAAPALVGNIPQQLCDGYEGQVLPSVVAVQQDDVMHTELIATNLFNPTETFSSLISEPGTWAGFDASPSFVAAGFRLVQDNGAIRNGSKRYTGIGENTNSLGVFNNPTFITALVALGASLILGVDSGIVTNAFLPIIVKRILDGTEYRLPENSGEAVYGDILDALFNLTVTSQTSRKIGRGD